MDCTICFETKAEQHEIKWLPCLHKLCVVCYGRLEKRICPFCRKPIAAEAIVRDPVVRVAAWSFEQSVFDGSERVRNRRYRNRQHRSARRVSAGRDDYGIVPLFFEPEPEAEVETSVEEQRLSFSDKNLQTRRSFRSNHKRENKMYSKINERRKD